MMGIQKVTEVVIFVNGRKYKVINAPPTLSLTEWLRTNLSLTGTKVMCVEAGCGCCVVAVSPIDPMKDPREIRAINSCLRPIMTLDGYHVITVEGIGSQREGLHEIQQKIVDFFGTQCGYCTPGFVMSGYSLLASNPSRSKEEIEKAFDGNICRCTGYRPIMDAMKSFADDPRTTDIEDFGRIERIYSNKKDCGLKSMDERICDLSNQSRFGGDWYAPTNLQDALQVLRDSSGKSVRLVAGNTAMGIYKDDGPYEVYMSLNNVKELSEIKVGNDHVIFGASISLSEMAAVLERNKQKSTFFQSLIDHISKIGNLPLRNAATWSGNLMLIHRNRSMASDVYMIFEVIGATLSVVDKDGKAASYTLSDFLDLDMSSKIITGLRVPFTRLAGGVCRFTGKVLKSIQSHFTQKSYILRTFKIMPRSGNCYAYVSAAFLCSDDQNDVLKDLPCLMFGAVNERIIRATKTENYLKGKSLSSHETLKGAIALLNEELSPHNTKLTTDGEFRKQTAIDCFYKFYLQLIGDKADTKFRSAAKEYVRPVSHGEQTFFTDEAKYPITQPVHKLEAEMQTTGEAKYVNDIPSLPNEVFAAAVLANMGSAILGDIDTTEAEKMPGYLGLVTHKDIPGKNLPMIGFFVPTSLYREMLVTEEVHYAGQVVALVVADTQNHANEIARKVKVNYKEVKKPVMSIRDAVEQGTSFPNRIPEVNAGDVDDAFSKSEKVISGEVESSTLHHFHIEQQVAVVSPFEQGYKIYCSSQCPVIAQNLVSKVLNVKSSKIDLHVPRVGGSFGGKGIYSVYNLALCSVAAAKLQRPVRLAMDFNTMLKFQGGRGPYLAQYKIGLDKDGLLQAIDLNVAVDVGAGQYLFDGVVTARLFDGAYFCPNWRVKSIEYKTNVPPYTFLRAPGHSQAIFVCETMMDHAAKAASMTPEEFRFKNMYKDGQRLPLSVVPKTISGCELQEVWRDLHKSGEFDRRREEVDRFNKENRWKKRGLCLGPMKWSVGYYGFNFTASISIFYGDGTVIVNHGGVDVGQGINTRVAQVAASCLGVDLDYVVVKENFSGSVTNGSSTGGSITTEINMIATKKCCDILNQRMKIVREENPNAKWTELVEECEKRRIDLEAKHMEIDMAKAAYAYDIYAAALIEAEIDVLTGERNLPRADLLLSMGECVNPMIDVGQVEGAFVMALGQWLHERIRYDKETGVELTAGTWEYKPPLAKDIPVDLRITFSNKGPNTKNPLGSKATGEPPMLLGVFAYFAIKDAIRAARMDATGSDDYFTLPCPLTVDEVQKACLVDQSQLTF